MVRSGDLPVLINISNDSNFERFKKTSDGANIEGNDYRLVAALQYRAGASLLRHPQRVRQNRRGDRVMNATLILIDSDAELARARALVERLWESDEPADIARLWAQARLIAAYEEGKWPRRPPCTADLIRHLMDQHGLRGPVEITRRGKRKFVLLTAE